MDERRLLHGSRRRTFIDNIADKEDAGCRPSGLIPIYGARSHAPALQDDGQEL